MNNPGETKRDNKPYDTAFKELAEHDPETLLRLVGALPQGASIIPLPREVTAPALYTDQPYLVTSGQERTVAHVEAQTYYTDDVPGRNVKYGAILWINTELPVQTYVLILSPRGMPANAPTEMTIVAGGMTLTARFYLIRLWEIDDREVLLWKRAAFRAVDERRGRRTGPEREGSGRSRRRRTQAGVGGSFHRAGWVALQLRGNYRCYPEAQYGSIATIERFVCLSVHQK
jgi:hypothetical protein